MHEFKVYVMAIVIRPVWIVAEIPVEAECIAEENYSEADVTEVRFDADLTSRRQI